jgi:hypothetical protein
MDPCLQYSDIEISACGVGILAGSVQTWEISACGVAIFVGGVQTWEISVCEVGIPLAVFKHGKLVRVW